MLVHILLFALGLLLLIKGGDWFVDGATDIAKRFHIPDLLIGATVVSIGTTLPEVMVSANSALEGYGAMAYGNAIGSIICNTSLIAALTIAIRPSKVNPQELKRPVAFFFIAAIFYAGTAYITGNFTRLTGIILLCMFVIYMVVVCRQAVLAGKTATAYAEAEGDSMIAKDDVPASPVWKSILFLVIGAAIIAWGADLLVDHGVALAEAFGVPQTVISLTFVALGTSLPELVTAINALIKGHGALSLGNICGANLFNLVLVSGISITLGPFSFSKPAFDTTVINGVEYFNSLLFDTPLMIIVMAILTIPALKTGKLKRWQGIFLLCIYAGFCAVQFCL